jgi:hypothetical protein
LAEPWDKNRCVSCVIYFLVIFSSSYFSLLTCIIALGIFHILKEQSSEGNFSLHSNLVLFTLTQLLDQVCVILSYFCRITYSPPSRCSQRQRQRGLSKMRMRGDKSGTTTLCLSRMRMREGSVLATKEKIWARGKKV